jgi:Zn-dependent protease
MFRSWKLGTAFGIGIYIHWTFLLLVGFFFYKFWGEGGPELGLWGLALLLSVFGCVVLHELGHALTARYFGIGTRDITLYPIGGVARLERMSEQPWEELWIALAGPAVNVVIAALLVVPALLTMHGLLSEQMSAEQALRGNFLFYLLSSNVILVLFNLLPAFPMDGGRVLRALLVTPLGRLRATEVAAKLGAVFALIFFVLGITGALNSPMLILVGAFAFLAGQQELAMVRHLERQRRLPPLNALPADAEVLDALPASPDAVVVSGPVWDDRDRVWVVWDGGRPVRTYWLE